MNAAQVPSELVSIVTASIIFFVSVHYIIERFVKPKNKLKEVSKDVYYNITHPLDLFYADLLSTTYFTSIGGVSLNVVVSLTSVLKELWLWEPFLELSLILSLQNNLEQRHLGFPC